MVPDAEFTSYYGRPVLKPSPWTVDIPSYLFLGGVAGGSALLGAGADLTDRPALRRAARFGAFGAILGSLFALIHDLGKPVRFLNMLRTFKPTSPMSIGTWILTAFGPAAGLAAAAEVAQLVPEALVPATARPVLRLTRAAGRPAGLASAALGPAVASYTAVLVSDTATPSWHDGYRQLPFVFVGSAAMASGGWGLLTAPPDTAAPARRLAIGGAVLETLAEHRMEQQMGLTAEPLHQAKAGWYMRASKALTGIGTVAAVAGRRNRAVSAVSGAALLAASACTRFGIFYAGQQSAQDPKYTVVPQRERVAGQS